MKSPTLRDLDLLSAYLDGELPPAERTRLLTRIESDPALRAALDDLRQVRTVLRRTPQRRAPRNFTLSAKMARIRPPVPRLVPVLSWVSAVATLLFVCTFAANLLPILAGPLAAAERPLPGVGGGYGGGDGNAPEAAYLEEEAATEAPAEMETFVMEAPMAPEPTAGTEQMADSGIPDQTATAAPAALAPAPEPTAAERQSDDQANGAVEEMPSLKEPEPRLTPLQTGLLALALILGAVALLVRGGRIWQFKRRSRK
ncbi:MAG: sigma-E factor negative regulatory protein [Anaerolineales bacterium]|nr:sigma-E factor negative regulatory protein [Anaerolineales bacterium]